MTTGLPLPKYHQIYLVLREQLHEGHFTAGLPSEMVLSKQFNVGRVTIRRALEQLSAEGLIVREAGRGTRPAPARTAVLAGNEKVAETRLTGLLQNIVTISRRTTLKVLSSSTVVASHAVAEALQIPAGSPVRKVVRRRSLKEGPVSYITSYIPVELASQFSRADLAQKPILQLLEESGIALGRAQQTVSARQADVIVAGVLGVSIGTALLSVRRIVYDTNDRPVQWLQGLYRPDRYEYLMDISQVGNINARISVKEHLSD
ncbi:GntR family transcriptional regulator [Actimicrobium sp. CCI2.3]|uniref:GntR family transcriptional regulator n=1 Tax=Actimicrobium sp. CCI2.3 TaxID=3048616 RepID=UPI002AB4E112|nr:GntR family transcriptional regulator [Actimicrobium sp. CCI2.3]MDY7574396.1 GntR family transcriptional regulator [Actimicrobium sp. CCI2.3]MEB0022525.1 GntR family transcriptional regulator [Actimicrobium sp. CCI2.3]